MISPLLWATRPPHQNAPWQKQLATLGDTLALPLMAIQPVSSQVDLQAIKNNVMDLDQFPHVIFVSQNAVAHAFDAFDRYWPQLPVGVNFYAVGSKTAEAVRNRGLEVIECGEAMNSEALLALPSLQKVGGDKVLICRGKGGRPLLASTLENRGALVSICELYHRVLPNTAKAQLAALPAQKHHIIPLFSGETLHNLVTALPDGFDRRAARIVVPTQLAADAAVDAGFVHVKVASNASQDAMLNATRQCLNP
ncbi:MAG TPA: uroporphyrinogen-III synthase [Marinagarivorans sp.]